MEGSETSNETSEATWNHDAIVGEDLSELFALGNEVHIWILYL